MAWFDTSEAMGALNAIGRDANNFIKRTIEEIEKDLARVDVNVGAPGLRFGNSRNGANNPGTSDGGSMGNEAKVKKAMACEGCAAKFSVWRRKHSLAWIRWARFNSLGYNSAGLRECLGCKQLFCSQCLPKVVPASGSSGGGWCSRERRQATCSKCLILLANPPSRSALLGLRTRDLQAFLASRRVPTHGCLEKDDLVNLIIQLSTYEVNNEANVPQGVPHGEVLLPSRNESPMSADSERRHDEGPLPSGDADEITPSVHSFGSRNEANSPTNAASESSPSRLSTPASSHSHAPSDATTLPCSGSTHNTVSPPASQTGQTSQSGSQFGVGPQRSNNPSTNDDGDWVMVDVEERPLPPYSGASLPSTPSTPTPPTPSSPSSFMTEPSLPPRSDVETESFASSRDDALNPEPTTPSSTGANTSPSLDSIPLSTSVSNSAASNPRDIEGSAQSSPAARSPLSSRTSASQGSSPSKGAGAFQTPRDLASSILSNATSVDDLSSLSVKQLKELLTSSRVDYRGCCEKQELLERAQRLWREYKASIENLSDDTMCKVCMDAAIDCVMLECGHMATCTPCGKRMSECPICRQYVIRIVRTFKA